MQFDRREFMKAALAATLWGVERLGRAEQAKSMVIQAFSRRSLRSGRINAEVVREMLDRSLMKLTKRDHSTEAWKTIATPEDTVGIKVNCIGRQNLSTHPELVRGIVEGLRAAGVDARNIIVFDRDEGEMLDAGFRPATVGGAACRVIREYSSQRVQFHFGSTRLARILEEITILINVPVLKDHQIAGVTIGMKNLSHGLCEDPMNFHDNNCDPGIAYIFGAEPIQKKLKLTICDAIIGVCDGGPTGMTNAGKWPCGMLLLGHDTVAIDRIGMDLIEARRRERGLRPLARRGTPPRHIITAGKLGLGNYTLDKIDLVRLEL